MIKLPKKSRETIWSEKNALIICFLFIGISFFLFGIGQINLPKELRAGVYSEILRLGSQESSHYEELKGELRGIYSTYSTLEQIINSIEGIKNDQNYTKDKQGRSGRESFRALEVY